MSDDQHTPPRPVEGGWGEQDPDATGFLPLTGGGPGYTDTYDYPPYTAARPGADPLAAPGQGYPPPDLSGWQRPDPDPAGPHPESSGAQAHAAQPAPLTPAATTDPASPGHWTLPFALGDGPQFQQPMPPDVTHPDPLMPSTRPDQGVPTDPMSSPEARDQPPATVSGVGGPVPPGNEVWLDPADTPGAHALDGLTDPAVASADWNAAPGGGASGQWVIPPLEDHGGPSVGSPTPRRPLADPDARRAPTPDPQPGAAPAPPYGDGHGDAASMAAAGGHGGAVEAPGPGPDGHPGVGDLGLAPLGGESRAVLGDLAGPARGGDTTAAAGGEPRPDLRLNDNRQAAPEGLAADPGQGTPPSGTASWFGTDHFGIGAAAEQEAGPAPRYDVAADTGPGPEGGPGDPSPSAEAVGQSAVRGAGAEPSAHTASEPSEPAPTADTEGVAVESDAPVLDSEHPHTSYVLRINGAERPVDDAWIGESLLYVLRERLGLAGAKDGCAQGECGACSVQVDGRLVASCLVPAAATADSEIRTVEGLATDGAPSDVQRALATHGAVQCGFCVPGLAMTLHDLLEGIHEPTELEVRKAISGNLCRCSGYRGVLEAVRAVTAERAARNTPEPQDVEAGPAEQPPPGGAA